MPTAQDITLSADQHELVTQALKGFSDIILGRGAELMRNRAVRSVEWLVKKETLQAKIQGGFLYTTLIHFEDNRARSECACEYRNNCKHAAALLLELRKNARSGPATAAKSQAPKPATEDPHSLPSLVIQKLKKPAKSAELRLLDTLNEWWTQKQRVLPQTNLFQLCGRQSYWGHGNIELYPAELPPKNVWEFLAYSIAALKRCQLPLPAVLSEVQDAKLEKHLLKGWEQLKEIARWRQSLSSWQDNSSDDTLAAPELRLQLLPESALVQIRQPGDAEFGKVTIKLLKEWGSQTTYGPARPTLSAGSHIVLRAAMDEYGSIRSTEISPLSSALTKSLTQLLSSEELFNAHVVGQEGESLLMVEESLRWELLPPKDSKGDYSLLLVDDENQPPRPPLAILSGSTQRYVTSEKIYTLPFWPFGKQRMSWPVHIPAAALETREGVSALGRLGVGVPERLVGKVRVVKADVQVHCKVHRANAGNTDYLHLNATARFDQDSGVHEWNGILWQAPHRSFQSPAEEDPDLIQLDRSTMQSAATWLRQLTLKPLHQFTEQRWVEQRIFGKDWPDQFIAWLERRPKDLTLHLDAELASLREGAVAGKVRLEVEESDSGMDWFDLKVALEVTDSTLSQDEISLLLKAKGKWVKLSGKGWRKLEFDLSEAQQNELADLGLAVHEFNGDKHRLHALQLGKLGQNSNLLSTERALQIQRRMEEIQTRITPDLPATITASLRPYQLSGFHFLAYLTVNRFGGVLADDMGLGKTLQTLAWIAWLRAEQKVTEPILVICPKSVQDNWRAEAQRFCPSLRVEVWNRTTAGKVGLQGDADLLVIHYPHLRIHESLLAEIQWGAVILDEAQAIKNPTAQSTKAACALNTRHRLALTGTPIENRLLDLWSIFTFAMPGVLGNRASFTRHFDSQEDPLARRRLAARTRPFLLRRTKKEVASDLPDRVEEDLIIELEGVQATLYQAELKRARAQLLKAETSKQLDKLRFNILTSLLRLRQICCHPRLIGMDPAAPAKGRKKASPDAAPAESAKVAALMELLEQLTEEGQKVLVFSQFVEMLEIIEEEIRTRGWQSFKLTGQTEDRGGLVEQFQGHEGPATFLISLKAGGFGLNLTAASYVVLFDPWWNPAVEAQAIDRTHRIGQKQTVFAYRLLIKDSIEEKIRLLQKQKGSLANDILGEENFAQALTLNDFHFLLGED